MSEVLPHCRIVPQENDSIQVLIGGKTVLGWNFRSDFACPCFFPVFGPSGEHLTRIGHPGAPDHDHHRSIWFGHQKVAGVDFWSHSKRSRIRQRQWFAYHEDDEQAAFAVLLEWADGHDPAPLIDQEMIAVVRPLEAGQWTLEIQSTFRPKSELLELGQTNFGFLGVRVARSISAVFGTGELQNSEGARTEKELFGKRARWVDYSGPIAPDVIEGITYFDHPSNPSHPTQWHVRNDGWMIAAECMGNSRIITREAPLVLRYLMLIHAGEHHPEVAGKVFAEFSSLGRLQVVKSARPHRQYQIQRTI